MNTLFPVPIVSFFAKQLGCLETKFDSFFLPEYFFSQAEVMAATMPLSV
jgi:hypothetical protein